MAIHGPEVNGRLDLLLVKWSEDAKSQLITAGWNLGHAHKAGLVANESVKTNSRSK